MNKLTIITYIIYFLEGIAVLFIVHPMYTFFFVQSYISDSYNILVSLIFIFHPQTSELLCRMCTAFSLHYIGISLGLITLMYQNFYVATITNGIGWIFIGGSSVLQTYLLKDILSNNHYIPIPTLNYKLKILLIGFIPILFFFLFVCYRFATQEPTTEEEKVWGDPIPIMLMRWLGPIFSFLGIYCSCYYARNINKNTV